MRLPIFGLWAEWELMREAQRPGGKGGEYQLRLIKANQIRAFPHLWRKCPQIGKTVRSQG